MRPMIKTVLLTLVLLAALPASAQEPDPAPDAAAMEDAPVPVPEPSELAIQRYRSGNVLWVVNQLWGLLIPALFLFTGFSARIRSWAAGIGKYWFFIIALYFVAFSAINYLIDLPLSFYQGYIREHAYGLSNQTLAKWVTDSLKELAVSAVIGVLFLWVPYLLLKKSPGRWWLYTGLLVPPFLFFQVLITPIWIAPLFNDFGPMENKELEAKILALAERAGIEDSRVFEVNKSVDTKAVNAYVTGFLNTKRIVLWDTLLAKLEDEEVLYVMGHEMGHYVLGHVVKFVIFASVLILLALYLIHRLSGALLRRHSARFGFSELSDVASLPLLLLMLGIFSLLVTPLILGVSRYHEREADRFGIELTRSNHAAAAGFVKLMEENLGVPRPGWLFKLWRASHPSIGERIDFLNSYKPWKDGQPLRYERYVRSAVGDQNAGGGAP